MLTQPKILTVIIANEDQAKTYTTINSLQRSHYRNHELVCLVPCELESLRSQLARDFKWLPIIWKKYEAFNALLQTVVERARYSFCDGICLIQAGTSAEPKFLDKLCNYVVRHPQKSVFIASAALPSDKTLVSSIKYGKWPFQIKNFYHKVSHQEGEEGSRFVGGTCLVRVSASIRVSIPNIDDEICLFMWVEKMLGSYKSISAYDASIFYNGSLFNDHQDNSVISESAYKYFLKYLQQNGHWYDMMIFKLKYSWRRENSVMQRLGDGRLLTKKLHEVN